MFSGASPEAPPPWVLEMILHFSKRKILVKMTGLINITPAVLQRHAVAPIRSARRGRTRKARMDPVQGSVTTTDKATDCSFTEGNHRLVDLRAARAIASPPNPTKARPSIM